MSGTNRLLQNKVALTNGGIKQVIEAVAKDANKKAIKVKKIPC